MSMQRAFVLLVNECGNDAATIKEVMEFLRTKKGIEFAQRQQAKKDYLEYPGLKHILGDHFVSWEQGSKGKFAAS